MCIRDLLRLWVAEQLFGRQVIILARSPLAMSHAQHDDIRRKTQQFTGYETFLIADSASTGVTYEFLPTARKRGELAPSELVVVPHDFPNGRAPAEEIRQVIASDRLKRRVPAG